MLSVSKNAKYSLTIHNNELVTLSDNDRKTGTHVKKFHQ